jgi:hypothetical protein
MNSKALRLILGVALILLALASMWMSYGALFEFALAAGFPESRALFFPLILDLVVVTAMLIALTTEHGRGYAWSTMVIFGLATVAGNSVHVLTIPPALISVPLWVAVIAGSLPAVALLLTTHLAAVSVFRPSVTVSDRVDPKPVVLELAGDGKSIAQIQRATGVARSTVTRWLHAAQE